MATPLTKSDLLRALQDLGLIPGDSLIVHSSLRTLGEVDGGADTVLDALLETLGPAGNLMLPTFNYTRPLPEPHFDPGQTPGRTGILPEIGRKRPGAVRSLHPTHSVAVLGPDAGELTRDHLKTRAFGIGSPIDRLAKRGGKVLLVGVGNNANSTIHVGEEYAGTPKASWYDNLPVVKVRLPDGRIVEHTIDTSPSCSAAFAAVEHALRRRGRIRDARIGSCPLQLMAGRDVIECTRDIIRDKSDILLCTWPGCRPCAGARRNLTQHPSKEALS
jgi:aminoglycoside 3-N-acetyltransferase